MTVDERRELLKLQAKYIYWRGLAEKLTEALKDFIASDDKERFEQIWKSGMK